MNNDNVVLSFEKRQIRQRKISSKLACARYEKIFRRLVENIFRTPRKHSNTTNLLCLLVEYKH